MKTSTALSTHSHGLAEVDAALAAAEAASRTEHDKLRSAIDALGARVLALETAEPPPDPEPSPIIDLQKAIDSAASGATLDLTGGTFACSGLTIRKPITLIAGHIDVASGNGITVLSRDVALVKTALSGNQTGQSCGIWAMKADGLMLDRIMVADWVYAGIMVLETVSGTVKGSLVTRIGMNAKGAANAYGIAISNLGGVQSSDIAIVDNTVDGTPNWHGIDTHAGKNLRITGNMIHRTNRAIFITSDNYGRNADNIEISRNLADTPTPRDDVRNTPPYNEVGITVVTGCTNVRGDANTLEGWPRGNAIDPQKSGAVFTNTVVR